MGILNSSQGLDDQALTSSRISHSSLTYYSFRTYSNISRRTLRTLRDRIRSVHFSHVLEWYMYVRVRVCVMRGKA